jgi:hypothetical protein
MRLAVLFTFCFALLLCGCGENVKTDPKTVTPPTVSNPLMSGGGKNSAGQGMRAD